MFYEFNISKEITDFANSLGLGAISTGGNCDYIFNSLENADLVLCSVEDHGSTPSDLDQPAVVTVNRTDAEYTWIIYAQLTFSTARKAMQFMASVENASAEMLGGSFDDPNSARLAAKFGSAEAEAEKMPDAITRQPSKRNTLSALQMALDIVQATRREKAFGINNVIYSKLNRIASHIEKQFEAVLLELEQA